MSYKVSRCGGIGIRARLKIVSPLNGGVGSSPTIGTRFGVGGSFGEWRSGSALGLGPRGRGFESHLSDHTFGRVVQMFDNLESKIVIVGGGFGGIRCALDLASNPLPHTKIILISDKPHFEYHPALYRVVTGRSPLEVCVPLRDVFAGKNVEVLRDTITAVNLKEKRLKGSSDSHYAFDFLVLSLGSETVYFHIPGLRELSFGFKSIAEALRLKRHLHELFSTGEKASPEERIGATHLTIVGGGASGVEMAGELAVYTKKLARKHRLHPSLIAIDLFEAAPRLLPALPEDVSQEVEKRLRSLGVRVFCRRIVTAQEIEEKTKTVIWTAGVKPHHLYTEIQGLNLDKRGRIVVDELLQAKGLSDVFVLGDAAATPHAGMAQTALYDGRFVAGVITRKILSQSYQPYQPKNPFYAIPVGSGWAAVLIGSLRLSGPLGWWVRRLIDLRFFFSLLSWSKALTAWRSDGVLSESCSVCQAAEGGE